MKNRLFSQKIIKQYQKELYETYGIFVREKEAEVQLRSLVRTLFPTDIAVPGPESRESLQGKDAVRPTCDGSLSGTMDAVGDEVGASITPTSGHCDTQESYE